MMGFLSQLRAGSVTSSFLRILAPILLTTSSTLAINFTAVPAPQLDLAQLGRIGLGGNFDSVSLYQYTEQGHRTFFTNGSQSVITRLPNGEITALATANGAINDMCLFVLSDGTMAGIVVGGNFTEIGGVPATAIALLNPNTGNVVQLTGLNGVVNAILCDQSQETVFVGGNFTGASSSNAIAWVGMVGWANLPFEGFNGPVESIVRSSNGSIIFGGQFDALGNITLSSTNTSSVSNFTAAQNQTQGVINLQSANITSTASSSQAGFSDPKNIVCSDGSDSSGNTWLGADNIPAQWGAEFAFNFIPARLRLNNTHVDGRGVKTFQFISRPNNGIMNLTSIDPVSNQRFYCDAWCPLSNSTTPGYQDYEFVNPIQATAFRIDISEWYGAGPGLAGIELFTNETFVYAVDQLNEPTCRPIEELSTASFKGPWINTGGPPTTDSEYLSATLSGDDLNTASVTYVPDVKFSGNYTVQVYSPGCVQDNTCAQRGSINVTGIFTSDGKEQSFQVFQTNDNDKYDQLYSGFVDASSPSFRPTITLKAATGQTGPINIVAQKINFKLIEAVATNSTRNNTSNVDVSLNGLFSYTPNTVPSAADYNASIINLAGSTLSKNARINTILMDGTVLYVGGNMTSDSIHNIFIVNADGAASLAEGGLDNAVHKIVLGDDSDTLYIGGEFSKTITGSTTGLSHVASYSMSKKTWVPLGNGLNGNVLDIIPWKVNFTSGQETVYAFSGPFTKILASGSAVETAVDGFAIWVPSAKEWLQRISNAPLTLEGVLTQVVNMPNGQILYSGNIIMESTGIAGAIALHNGPLAIEPFGVTITPNTGNTNSTSSKNKRALPTDTTDGVVTGAFYTGSGANVTILGGRFTANGTNGPVYNLAFIDEKSNGLITGFPSGTVAQNSTFQTLVVDDKLLYAGGNFLGTVNTASVGGFVIYDMSAKSFVSSQPPPLQGGGSTVFTIAPNPSSTDIYVGGDFIQAGGLACVGMCKWVTSSSQWFPTGFSGTGAFYTSEWLNPNTLLVGGSFGYGNGTKGYMMTYDVKASVWSAFGLSSNTTLPGPVSSFTLVKSDGTELFASGTSTDGSSFLVKWDGAYWTFLSGLSTNSVVAGVQVLYVSTNHVANTLLDATRTLMVTGSIMIPSSGVNASAALYDGVTWTPFLLTSSRSSGSSGAIGSFFSEKKQSFDRGEKHLALGLVVLISLAIALGLIFLLVVIGVLASYIRRRREGYTPVGNRMPAGGPDMRERIRPDELFGGVNQPGRMGAGGAPMI